MNPRAAMAAFAEPIRSAMAPFHDGQPTARDVANLRTAIASVEATRVQFERDASAALSRSDALQAGLSENPLPATVEMVATHREYVQDLARMAVELLGLEDALRTIAQQHERGQGGIR